MKIEELKHNHSLTDLLKILLFAILMLAPIGMVATRCLYVIANKNAYQSYSGSFDISYKYESNDVSSTNDLITGNIYNLKFEEQPTDAATYKEICWSSAVYNVNNFNNSYTLEGESNNNYYRIRYNNTLLLFSSYNYASLISVEWANVSFPYTFDFVLYDKQNISTTSETYQVSKTDFNVITNINTTGSLDNVFEYSVSQLEESNLFNWTENTAIYSGINAMNVQLGINSPAITIVLTYWLILTCIYVIIDIVLKIFTYLTHMIGSRKS